MHVCFVQEVQRPSKTKVPVAVVALVGASIRLAANKDLAQSTLELGGCGLIQQALVVFGNDGETAAVDRPGASHDRKPQELQMRQNAVRGLDPNSLEREKAMSQKMSAGVKMSEDVSRKAFSEIALNNILSSGNWNRFSMALRHENVRPVLCQNEQSATCWLHQATLQCN